MSDTAPNSDQRESVVVDISRLDTLLDLAGKVIIVSSDLEALRDRLEDEKGISEGICEESKDLASTASRISSDLHHLVIDVRHVSMGDSFARFRRLARDVSRRVGKPIRFEAIGGDITLDKVLSERIYDPIAHQIRNAIVHGIESSEVRSAAGKDPMGIVRLEVKSNEQLTTIEVCDDGAGIDLDAVRRVATKRGLATQAELDRMSDDDLYQFLFVAGFSTAEQTSSQAGRGVGMDVVRTVLDGLNGECQVESRSGRGSKITFLLPNISAVNISDTLMVAANETHYAFPIGNVLASVCVDTSEIRVIAGLGRVIPYLGEYIPLEDLSRVFGEAPIVPHEAERVYVLVVQHKQEKTAFQISEFLSPQKVVISELDPKMSTQGIQGVAVLSGQRLGMVVDVQNLFDRMRHRKRGDTQKISANTNRPSESDGAEAEPLGGKADRLESDPKPPAETRPRGSTADAPGEAFLRELKTMLGAMNRELLQLDENRDRETTDSVFRLIHSIKGNLAMCGLDEPADITHHLETLLDRAREGVGELEDATFDMLFDGCEYLEEVVRAMLIHANVPPPTPRLVQAIHKSTEAGGAASSTGEDTDEDDAIVLDALGEFQISAKRMTGHRLVQADIDFDSADQPAYLVAYIILRRFQKVGDVIGTSPPIDRISSGVCGTRLRVLFVPHRAGDDPLRALEANLSTHFGVTRLRYEPYC